MNNDANVIDSILEDVQKDMKNEQLLHHILEKKIASNYEDDDDYTFGEKAADTMARFAGSWTFIIAFTLTLVFWIILNLYLLTRPFDPFPFILLNLVLSCIAAIQAPLIMMSQNRQEVKDRERAENDYRVNLKTEIIIQDLHNKLDQIMETQTKIVTDLEQLKK